MLRAVDENTPQAYRDGNGQWAAPDAVQVADGKGGYSWKVGVTHAPVDEAATCESDCTTELHSLRHELETESGKAVTTAVADERRSSEPCWPT